MLFARLRFIRFVIYLNGIKWHQFTWLSVSLVQRISTLGSEMHKLYFMAKESTPAYQPMLCCVHSHQKNYSQYLYKI